MPGSKHEGFAARSNEELLAMLHDLASSEASDPASDRLKEEIVVRNVGLVKSIALKFLSSGEPLDDLIQAGYIGLLNAVSNFDLARNTKFSTYASYLIQGEIRHYIRDKHATIRIPQWVQTMNRKLKVCEEAFFQKHGRPPSLSELAEASEMTEDQLVALLRGRESMTYVSIDQERRGSDPNPAPPSIEQMMPASDGLSSDAKIRILIAIERLGEVQQQVIAGLFYEGKSQSELGKELGISQRQVSRMKDRILREMKDELVGTSEDVN